MAIFSCMVTVLLLLLLNEPAEEAHKACSTAWIELRHLAKERVFGFNLLDVRAENLIRTNSINVTGSCMVKIVFLAHDTFCDQ